MLQLFDGPANRHFRPVAHSGRPIKDGGYISGTIIKPKLGLRPEPFAKAAYQFWLGGDFIKNDEPQGNQVFCPIKKVLPLVYDAMKRAMDETGEAKLFSMNITADDHYEMWPAPTTRWKHSARMQTRWHSWLTVSSAVPA